MFTRKVMSWHKLGITPRRFGEIWRLLGRRRGKTFLSWHFSKVYANESRLICKFARRNLFARLICPLNNLLVRLKSFLIKTWERIMRILASTRWMINLHFSSIKLFGIRWSFAACEKSLKFKFSRDAIKSRFLWTFFMGFKAKSLTIFYEIAWMAFLRGA